MNLTSLSLHPRQCRSVLGFPRHMRRAYSILELMIALGLLSVLLLLGWSLMQTIQDAEVRSWKLTQRVRVLRTTRAWLADDMDHLVRASQPVAANSIPLGFRNPVLGNHISNPAKERFEGDATGFIATISPSLDPIRFFDRLMSSQDSMDAASRDVFNRNAMLASDNELAVREARESLWPERGIDVEYRLEPVGRGERKVGANQVGMQEAQDIQFELVRREWIQSEAAMVEPAMNSADRKLSSTDLYRGTQTSEDNYTPPLKESRLYAMVQAEFYYFDGVAWSQEWHSNERGGVPKAVAISFDFPPPADFVRPESNARAGSGEGEIATDSLGNEFLGSLNANPKAVLDPDAQDTSLSDVKDRLVESSDREVVIVVETGNRSLPLATPQTAGVFQK